MKSDMTIPLRARGQVMGAFRVACRRRHAFDPEDFEVLKRCADMTAVPVETQRLLLATKRLAELDGVTGVYNHRHFRTLLDQEIDRARRSRRPVALIMVDIDYFKRFNDTYGHQAGDEVLRHVAQLTARVLRRSDAVARYGGEEFVVILEGSTMADAARVAEEIRGDLEARVVRGPDDQEVRVTVSAGCAQINPSNPTREALIEKADNALFAAKRAGRNRVISA